MPDDVETARSLLAEVRALYTETDDAVNWHADPWEAVAYIPGLVREIERLTGIDPKRGECGVCGKLIVLKKDGTLRDHVDSNIKANGWAQQCEGVGEAPRVRSRG